LRQDIFRSFGTRRTCVASREQYQESTERKSGVANREQYQESTERKSDTNLRKGNVDFKN